MAGEIKQVKTSDNVLHDLEVDLSGYYDKTETDTLLNAKANADNVYSKSDTDLLLSQKADKTDIYTKAQLDDLFNSKANVNTVYTKGETDSLLSGKADVSNTYSKSDVDSLLVHKANLSDVYTKAQTYDRTQIGNLLSTKAEANDVYTKTEADALLGDKADASNVYTKTEADTLLGAKADANDVYNITQMDTLLDGKADVGDGVPVGAIHIFGGLVAPSGYLLCDGSEVAIADYTSLYNVIGDNFGTASDTDHFILPDMRECVPKGAGLYGGTVGAHVDADGLAVGEFLDDRIQGHEHTQYYSSTRGSFSSAGGSGMDNQRTTETTGIIAGTNGTPRVGNTTEVKSVGVNYIIKY